MLTRPTPLECVIAPHLTSAASTIATWTGRVAIHGGAFLHAGAAWVLLGDKGHGKSTTLGWLATAGVPVITDDLVVCDEGHVLAGPRCVRTCRPEPARWLEAGRDLGVIGTRERWRIDGPTPCPVRAPLWVAGSFWNGAPTSLSSDSPRSRVWPGCSAPRHCDSVGKPWRCSWTWPLGLHTCGTARKGGATLGRQSIGFSPRSSASRRQGVRRRRPRPPGLRELSNSEGVRWQRTTRHFGYAKKGSTGARSTARSWCSTLERSHYLNLNPTGSVLWLLLADGATLRQLLDKLMEEFDVTEQTGPQPTSRRCSPAATRNGLLADPA